MEVPAAPRRDHRHSGIVISVVRDPPGDAARVVLMLGAHSEGLLSNW